MRRMLSYIFKDVNEAVRAVVGRLVTTSEDAEIQLTQSSN